ncbi:MAG: hypothetical protein RMN24_05490 [Anaerolineae bacterium]|nr:hypothetical protein [Anaerolineae bacterium]
MSAQAIVVVAVVIFMGWFALGMIYNLRRGERLLKWMQGGLPLVGQRTTFRWLGTSVAELGIARAKRPLQRLDILLVLKPRDVFWLTLLALAQGRDDVLIFRAHLSTPPLVDLELADPKTWSGRAALNRVAARGWEATDYHGLRLMAPKGMLGLAAETLDRLALPMQAFSPRYVRFGLYKNAPNLEIHVPFPDPQHHDAQTYFRSLQDLVGAIGRR